MPLDPRLEPFNALVGAWEIEATHPMFPSTVVRGTAEFEWLEGERFLSNVRAQIIRSSPIR